MFLEIMGKNRNINVNGSGGVDSKSAKKPK